MDPLMPPRDFILVAIAVEGGMGAVAVLLGWLLNAPPGNAVQWESQGVLWGAIAAVPLLAVLGVSIYVPWRPFVDLLRMMDDTVIPLFRNCRLIDFALIAALAGLGEEMLFRGVLQPVLARQFGGPAGDWLGLFGAGLLFGLAHSITRTYAVLAAAIGLYLGWLLMATGNLLAPIAAHTIYDFLALVYLVRIRRQPPLSSESSENSGRSQE